MINRTHFFDHIRPVFGPLKQSQVNGFEVILNHWDLQYFTDLRHLAYMLATAWHETAGTMQPIEEYGRGKGRPYGRKVKHSGVAYSTPDRLYYGRGFVQLTWYENYQLMGRLLNQPLLMEPELALDPLIACEIMFEGMLRGSSSFGDFTGKCLEQYFNDSKESPVEARKIINGTDKAVLIAKYYEAFKQALS